MFKWISKLAFWKKRAPIDKPNPYIKLAGLAHIDPEKLKALLAKVQEPGPNTELVKMMLEPMRGRRMEVPESSRCTKCGSEKIHRIWAPAWGRWGGYVVCEDCGHKESVMNHLAKTCISVEPLSAETIFNEKR